MKRFIVSVLCVSVFFIGLGTLVEKVGAKLRSDDKALALIAQARQAIGGDQALAAVKSMTITGKVAKTFDMNGEARVEPGDLEINMQMPDKFSRMVKIGSHDGSDTVLSEKTVGVMVRTKDGGDAKVMVDDGGTGEGARQIIKIRKADGDTTVEGPDSAKGDVVFVRKTGDGGTWTPDKGEVRDIVINRGEGHGEGIGGAHHQDEMLRATLTLLLSTPEGIDVGYTYIGEESVDGSSCDVINADVSGSSYRLYLDRSSHLPKMISYQAPKPMIFTVRLKEGDANGAGPGEAKVFTRTVKGDAQASGEAKVFTTTVKGDGPGGEPQVFTRRMAAPEMAQYHIKFSDYRSVSGVQLPYRWTQTVGGKDDEVTDITGYEINPANIAEKFQNTKVMVRTKKPDTQQ